MKHSAKALCAFLLLSISSAQSATPTALNYQGRLTTGSGTPVADGSYSVVFSIYDAALGGNSKWTETQIVTTSGGLFAVLLGTIAPVSDTVFNDSSRYLGIRVGTDPELTPRTRLVTVPFASRVSTVDGSTGGRIFGNINLENSTGVTGNIFKANTPFLHNFGTDNSFVGFSSGNLTMSGKNNAGCGNWSLFKNTSGSSNTASGYGALFNNTAGSGNTASGIGSLYNNTAGNGNTASGENALSSNSTGDHNTATGTNALYFSSTADSNTANGYSALFSNTTGDENVACGAEALYFNTTGRRNAANGWRALYRNTDGYSNIAVGGEALYNNLTGSVNTACG